MTQVRTERRCDECGVLIPPYGKTGKSKTSKRFCSTKCKGRYNNRRATRGASIYDLAMAWRRDRTKEGLSDLCHQIGIFLRHDVSDERQTFNRHDKYPYVIPRDDPKPYKGGKGSKGQD